MEVQLFLDTHVEAVHQFEKARLPKDLSPVEAEMKSWESPWRLESLNHYCQLGWSFIAIDGDEIKGYLLGQPILFFNNWTQTLWVETMNAESEEVGQQLLDVTVRWAKTKHLQKVLMNTKIDKLEQYAHPFNGFKEGSYLHLSTTKLHEE